MTAKRTAPAFLWDKAAKKGRFSFDTPFLHSTIKPDRRVTSIRSDRGVTLAKRVGDEKARAIVRKVVETQREGGRSSSKKAGPRGRGEGANLAFISDASESGPFSWGEIDPSAQLRAARERQGVDDDLIVAIATQAAQRGDLGEVIETWDQSLEQHDLHRATRLCLYLPHLLARAEPEQGGQLLARASTTLQQSPEHEQIAEALLGSAMAVPRFDEAVAAVVRHNQAILSTTKAWRYLKSL